eukprot:CAMPEP_0185155316 /NCGR_PEP_ID=MMETSP1139-20130426/363_1 /TAXON_ID=298111 /ORGANISM="Pavlova sp., Strain CCMP459" /LENGTH=301 /DNA_ID=CAMNT_0027720207 /DNA_START=31 /DNA_END=939 /DNA_ORIENTATION=-
MGAGSSAQAAPAKPSSAMQETRVEVPAEAPQGGAPATWTEEESVCVICLDSNNTAADPLLSGLCACTSSAIHHSCLEKLINSGRRRVMPLEERVSCPVCTRGYDVPHTFYVLRPRSPAYHPSHPTGSQLLFRTLCTVFLAFLTVGYLARFIFPVLTDSAFFIVVAVLSLVCLMLSCAEIVICPPGVRAAVGSRPTRMPSMTSSSTDAWLQDAQQIFRTRAWRPDTRDDQLRQDCGARRQGKCAQTHLAPEHATPAWCKRVLRDWGHSEQVELQLKRGEHATAVMEASTSFAPPAAQRIVSV